MTLNRAIHTLEAEYERAKQLRFVRNPIAWALYQVWKVADRDKEPIAVDIGQVNRRMKPKADSTLRNMRKDDLIDYICCLENNYNVAVTFNENQARYIESLGIVTLVRCKDCRFGEMCSIREAMACTSPEGYCYRGERKSNAKT